MISHLPWHLSSGHMVVSAILWRDKDVLCIYQDILWRIVFLPRKEVDVPKTKRMDSRTVRQVR